MVGSFWLLSCLIILVANKLFLWLARQVPSAVPPQLHCRFLYNMPLRSWECFQPVVSYLIISRRFPIVSFWQKLNDFHNLSMHPNHITDFTSVFSSYTFYSFIMLCFSSPQWLLVRLYNCNRWGSLTSIYFLPLLSVNIFGDVFEHFILVILGFTFSCLLILWTFSCTFCFNVSVNSSTSLAFVTPYFGRTFLFFRLCFPLSQLVPVSASIGMPFLQ